MRALLSSELTLRHAASLVSDEALKAQLLAEADAHRRLADDDFGATTDNDLLEEIFKGAITDTDDDGCPGR